ncbi:MAG: N-acetyltransferase [Chloroflexi bacterium]|nr:N-acetyltransferase [Chloroflexota bacterium]
MGSLLVKAGLERAGKNNLKVQALCRFTNGHSQRRAEYQNLVR